MRVLFGPTRFQMNGTLVQENFHTAWVRLWNGDLIKRKKLRDFVDYAGDSKLEKDIVTLEGMTRQNGEFAGFRFTNKKASWISRFINWVTSFFRGPKEKEKNANIT